MHMNLLPWLLLLNCLVAVAAIGGALVVVVAAIEGWR